MTSGSDEIQEFNVGDRVRLSAIGLERSPRMNSACGVIVGLTGTGNAYRVLFDNKKLAVLMHKSYIVAE
jgi:hypothetical protein